MAGTAGTGGNGGPAATYGDRSRPGSGGQPAVVFPWHVALDEVERLLGGAIGTPSTA